MFKRGKQFVLHLLAKFVSAFSFVGICYVINLRVKNTIKKKKKYYKIRVKAKCAWVSLNFFTTS